MDQPSYRCGEFLIESANRRFSRNGAEIPLEPRVFAVVAQLLAHPGELVARDQLLDAVWGHRFVTPSTLNRVIALARRAFADDVDSPRYIQTVHGAGYRYVGPIERHQSSAADLIHARFAPPLSASLPAPLDSLVGRDSELIQLAGLFDSGRAVTIVGSGGMGKTQCALAFAHAGRFPDGVWFFDLVALQRAEQWLEQLALAQSIPPSRDRDLAERVARGFAGRSTLLLLDNCDRVSADVGRIVVSLLRGAEQLRILATSQLPLSFVGERLLRLPPLALPAIRQPAAAVDLVEIATAPAVALLLARIRAVQPEFSLHEGNAAAIVEICERLDGMPLALELAAARFALLSPAQVLERLAQRFRFLTSDAAGRDARHRNLAALLDWSFQLLSPEERRLLTWLGVFVQGWTVEAVVALAAAQGSGSETAIDLLGGLVGKSLVAVDQAQSPPRYRLLESVREFALQRLAAMHEERPAREAHLAYVGQLAELAHLDLLGGRMRERIATLLHEHGNIESAIDFALTAGGDPQRALQIAGSLTLYFKAHGNNGLGLRLSERALRGAPATRTHARALALMNRGVNGVMQITGEPQADLTEAAAIAHENGDEWTAAYAGSFYALWLSSVGRVDEAAALIPQLERSAAHQQDSILVGLAALARGWMHLAAGDNDAAITVLRPVRELGDDLHQHHFIEVYIGLALFRCGDLAAAAGMFRDAIVKGLAVRHSRGLAASLEGCGYIATRLGHGRQACLCLGAAEQIRERTGNPLFSFWTRHSEQAHAALRTELAPADYAAAIAAGTAMREEDAVNACAGWLRSFALSEPLS